jgi:hypothetical protein
VFSKLSRSNTSIGLKLTFVRQLARIICSSGLGPRHGSYLDPAIDGFKPVKRVQELEADVSHLIRTRRELLGVLDGKPDAVDGNTRLVRHLELHWRGPGLRASVKSVPGSLQRVRFSYFVVSLPQKDPGCRPTGVALN